MLKEFKLKNFKSFRDEEVFSLEAMNEQEENLDCFNIAEIGEERILKSIVVYGHNSYGKTNLFKGFLKMLEIIRESSNPSYNLNIENFKLNNFSDKEPTKFEVSFILNETTYRYGFEILEESVNKEWLFKWKKEEVKIFERKNSNNHSIEISDEYEILKKYIEFTRENELFLSSMEKNNISNEIKEICDFLRKKINVISASTFSAQITSSMILDNTVKKEQVLQALQSADLGIKDFEVKKEEKQMDELPEFLKSLLKIADEKGEVNKGKFYSTSEEIKHDVYSKENIKVGEKNFDINIFESEGTQKLYSIIGPIIDTLNNGKILFIDELDSKLHHYIVKYILELFNDEITNKNNAQLIFNTHDFYLLKEKILRKDQIYFVDKDKYGVSNLYSLGDFKDINNETNIIAHYLLGHFGAIGHIE